MACIWLVNSHVCNLTYCHTHTQESDVCAKQGAQLTTSTLPVGVQDDCNSHTHHNNCVKGMGAMRTQDVVWHPGGKTKLTPHYGLACNSKQPPILRHTHSCCHVPYHLADVSRTLYAQHVQRSPIPCTSSWHAPVSNTTWNLQSSIVLLCRSLGSIMPCSTSRGT